MVDKKHIDSYINQAGEPAVSNPVKAVVMRTNDVIASLGVPAHLFGKNNQIFVDMPNLPDRNKLCDVVFKDGSKGVGKLSIARGWFKVNGDPFTNKSPIAKWRYKYA